jgi:hypothetical protein
VAYFMYPAIYPLAAAGIVWLSARAPGRPRWLGPALAVVLVAALIGLTNADLVGLDQLTLWFHHSQGYAW